MEETASKLIMVSINSRGVSGERELVLSVGKTTLFCTSFHCSASYQKTICSIVLVAGIQYVVLIGNVSIIPLGGGVSTRAGKISKVSVKKEVTDSPFFRVGGNHGQFLAVSPCRIRVWNAERTRNHSRFMPS